VEELCSTHNEIARWFRELQHFGFIARTTAGYLGVNGKGKAPHWRLTELSYMTDSPTRDFARWDGTPFRDQKTDPRTKTESRAGNRAHPMLENQHTSVPENQHTFGDKRAGNPAHIEGARCAGNPAHTKFTTRMRSSGSH
jgi:hypothetical protein